ncbi:MAG: M20/M25/M40 family metallo-hydrolase [Candidatus Lokiarchaeota archaeon]|nr:M20/M25/M40 family metallo-hydrolase [Candidatus Lokiarchaeota archaeon]MBD3198506.1 M20/M25/M40 family metallo-hydrolase [Candidatus Lokiarchaeota archaeon]
MNISQQNIREHLRTFSFPRLSGTEFEKKASNLAIEEIRKLGLNPQIQRFKFSTFYSRVYPKITFPLTFWVVLSFYLGFNPGFLLLNFLIISVIFLPFFIITRKPETIRFGKVLESQNVYVRLEPISKPNDVQQNNREISNVFFIAHLDSKGQQFIARTRFLSILGYSFSLISLGIVILLRELIFMKSFLLITIIGFFPLLVNFICVLILSLNTTNNNSKGVVDNASGVSCVLELLRYYSESENRLKDINLWFVLTGAEETGTMGIRNFLKIMQNVDKETSLINNFESLGKGVAVFISKNNLDNNPAYYKRFEEKAAEFHFRTQVSSVNRGVHTDGIYLFQNDFNLFEFGSTDVGKFMHSENDNLGNVSPEILKKLCEFLVELLEETQNKK